MGTRADFYVGKGLEAEWIGSVAFDGYMWDKDKETDIATASTEIEFREAVKKELDSRDDATTVDMGWPWPWEDSCTTDYAYCYTEDGVEAFIFGRPVYDEENEAEPPKAEWPEMKGYSAEAGSRRSGIMMFGA